MASGFFILCSFLLYPWPIIVLVGVAGPPVSREPSWAWRRLCVFLRVTPLVTFLYFSFFSFLDGHCFCLFYILLAVSGYFSHYIQFSFFYCSHVWVILRGYLLGRGLLLAIFLVPSCFGLYLSLPALLLQSHPLRYASLVQAYASGVLAASSLLPRIVLDITA